MASEQSPDFAAFFPHIQHELACPVCHAELRLEGAQLICTECGRVYAIVEGIPLLIAES